MLYSSYHLLILVTTLFYCLQSSIAGNGETDRTALLKIKAKTTDDPLGVMRSWNDTVHFCSWHGVTCGRRDERVMALDLQSSKLSGTISPFIGNLSFLRVLQLQNNSFEGTIPPEIGRLHRLHTLWLYNNYIGGEIPSNISGCSSLVKLDLFNNKLVGEIPHELGFLSHLQYLYLSQNHLRGTIPSSLGNLSSLTVLNFARNNLHGSIPLRLGNLKKLIKLSLVDNKLSGKVPPSIFNLSLMEVLDLGVNNLEGNLPSDLGNTLPYLQQFSVAMNQFTGYIPSSISNSSYLESLILSSNNFQGQVPSLHKLEKLKALNLNNNYLGKGQASDLNFVSSLANATMLQRVEISLNNFGGIIPRTICNFSMLTVLTFYFNDITGEVPTCIENLTKLQILGVHANLLSGVIPQGIGKIEGLHELRLNDNQFSGVIPPSIGNLTMMTLLDLHNNSLEGEIPSVLGNCGSLLGLDLSHNNLSGRIPSQLFSLSTLSMLLDLSSNRLVGSLPEEVEQLNNLEVLNVSRNMLSGEIPSSLSSCIALDMLGMEGNYFQGAIPNALVTLKGLRVLDLSRNKLSGKIPNFLKSLQLQVLNLSYNNLEGAVPSDGVFSNVTAFSVHGNNRLCGGIPQLKLPHCNFNNTQKRRPWRKLTVIILSTISGVTALVALYVLYIFRHKRGTKTTKISSDLENLPNLSYQTLLKATNGFSEENLIGSGTFGVVYKGNFDENISTAAIKVFKLEHHGGCKSFMAECEVLRNIRHRNLVKVISACSSVDYQGNDFKALVYAYMVNGSLDDWLHPSRTISGLQDAPRTLNFRHRLDIAVDVAFALEYLHHSCGASIVHCDLKPSNVLLDNEMVAHLGDFGLAKFLSEDVSSSANQSNSIGFRGTIGYAPPEYGLGNEASTYGDVYSFGILLLELFTGKRPTNEMFRGGMNLHNFVKAALPEGVTEILDNPVLLDIVGEETGSRAMLESIELILGIAVSCSAELPHDRLSMSDVSAKLSSIRNKLIGTRRQQRRRILAGGRGD